MDRKFYLVTPCHCDIEAGVGVTRVWCMVLWWPHSDNASVYNLSDVEVKRRNFKNPLDASKVTLGQGDFIDI